MRERNKRNLAVWALVIALCATSVAYAALQTTLSISGSVTKKGGEWDVHFSDVAHHSGTALDTAPAASGTNLSFKVTLKKPQDYTIIRFKVTNDGSINAKLKAPLILTVGDDTSEIMTSFSEWDDIPTSNEVSCILSPNYSAPADPTWGGAFSFDTFSGVFQNLNNINANSSSEYVYLKCLYNAPESNDGLSSEDAEVSVTLNLNYEQE